MTLTQFYRGLQGLQGNGQGNRIKISRHIFEMMCVQGYSLQHYLYSKILQTIQRSIPGDHPNKLWHIHTIKWYDVIKNNEDALYVLIWEDLQFKKQNTEQSIYTYVLSIKCFQ